MSDIVAIRRPGPLHANLDLICDPQVGIVGKLMEVSVDPGEPQFFHYIAWACNVGAFVTQKNFRDTGGASVFRETAIAKAVGEAIERYAAAIYDRKELPLVSRRGAPFRTVDPEDFALHASGQYARPDFPWVPFGADTKIRWSPAVDLATGETVHLPAAFIWIPYGYVRGSDDSPIGQPISTGLACHGSVNAALLTGLLEVVERDCFTIMWQAMMAPPQLRTETLPNLAQEMVRRFEVTGDRVIIFDITSDNGIPCFLSVLKSEIRERPAFVFAASADLDPMIAVVKALEELAHTSYYTRRFKLPVPRPSAANEWEEVRGQNDHLAFASDHANVDLFSFLLCSSERISFSAYRKLATGQPERDVRICVDRVLATGHRVYAADLTSEDVIALGLYVQRVVIPGYHPLFMGHRLRALGGRRLYEVPQRLGQTGIRPGIDNPSPHPYP